jgi:ubiquinone/menaquinone biosynthesis C-methylase UbiE
MSFDYEQSIWGRGTARLRPSDPTSIRLRRALEAIARVPVGGKVLEFGCGAGQFIRAIKQYRPHLDCYGSDISATAIDIAKSANDGVFYSVAETEKTPYDSSTFDAVLIFDVLEHVDNPAAILAEVYRVLRPGGVVYAFVPCENDSTSVWHALEVLHLKKDLTRRFAGHIQYFTRRQLVLLFSDASFGIRGISYSEQLLGQLVGVAAFFAMARAAKRSGNKQINNEDYFGKQQSTLRFILSWVVNSLIFLESALFRGIPSPNVHVVAEKPLPIEDARGVALPAGFPAV